MSCLQQLSFQVEGRLKALDQVLGYFDQIDHSGIAQKEWLQCQLALVEGFTNAVRHAHRNLPPEVPIQIDIELGLQELAIRIWDWGPPFDLEGFLEARQPPKELLGQGQGLPILQKIATHLSYTRSNEGRNCLHLIKQLQQ